MLARKNLFSTFFFSYRIKISRLDQSYKMTSIVQSKEVQAEEIQPQNWFADRCGLILYSMTASLLLSHVAVYRMSRNIVS